MFAYCFDAHGSDDGVVHGAPRDRHGASLGGGAFCGGVVDGGASDDVVSGDGVFDDGASDYDVYGDGASDDACAAHLHVQLHV